LKNSLEVIAIVQYRVKNGPAIPLLGNEPKINERYAYVLSKICSWQHYLQQSTGKNNLNIHQLMMNKMWYSHTVEYNSLIKRNKILPYATM
jgi:hypothetical protein